MAQQTASRSEPRKSPVQARSTASVDAILKATVQVLLRVGKEKLTITRVAARAGVSVERSTSTSRTRALCCGLL